MYVIELLAQHCVFRSDIDKIMSFPNDILALKFEHLPLQPLPTGNYIQGVLIVCIMALIV